MPHVQPSHVLLWQQLARGLRVGRGNCVLWAAAQGDLGEGRSQPGKAKLAGTAASLESRQGLALLCPEGSVLLLGPQQGLVLCVWGTTGR